MRRAWLLHLLALAACGTQGSPPELPALAASASAEVVPAAERDLLSLVAPHPVMVLAARPGAVLSAVVGGALPGGRAPELVRGPLGELGLAPELADALLGGSETALVALDPASGSAGAVVRFVRASEASSLVSGLPRAKEGPLELREVGGRGLFAAELADQRAVALGTKSFVSAALSRMRSAPASLTPSIAALAADVRGGGLSALVAMQTLMPTVPALLATSEPLRLSVSLAQAEPLFRATLPLALTVPLRAEPAPLTLAESLPSSVAGYFALSLAREPDSLSRLPAWLEAAELHQLAREVATIEREADKGVGLRLSSFDALLGDQLVVAAMPTPEGIATVATVELRDEAAAKAALARLASEARRRRLVKVQSSATSVMVIDGATVEALELGKGTIHLVVGAAAPVRSALSALRSPTATLGARASLGFDRRALGRLWLDLASVAKALGSEPLTGTSMLGLRLERGEGDVVVLEGTAGVAGALVALAARAVERYLAKAKTAEARLVVGAMGRAAEAAFDNADPPRSGKKTSQLLCPTAPAVPAAVPKAAVTIPAASFEAVGWKCLRFAMSHPVHYQYEYRRGANYKSVKRGGPNPGPHGFEVSAEGDLDGDGITSLFVRTGQVVNGDLVLSPELLVFDELE
jgi:hypothetical protein